MNPKQNIVQAIKSLGYNQRQVSVKDKGGSLSWAFDVTIRDPKVNFKAVEKAVKSHESYERDLGGDILAGGNTFIFTRISDEVKEVWLKEYETSINDAIVKLENEDRQVEIISNYFLQKNQGGFKVIYRTDKHYEGVGYDRMSTPVSIATAIHLHKTN